MKARLLVLNHRGAPLPYRQIEDGRTVYEAIRDDPLALPGPDLRRIPGFQGGAASRP